MATNLGPIGQIHVTVEDVDRSVAFYRDVLGIPFLFQVPDQPMAFFDCDGIRLYLGKAESPEFQARSLIYFTTPDMAATFEDLRSKGVEFESEPHVVHRTDEMELQMAFFKDPDGNHLALMSERNL